MSEFPELGPEFERDLKRDRGRARILVEEVRQKYAIDGEALIVELGVVYLRTMDRLLLAHGTPPEELRNMREHSIYVPKEDA